MHRGWLVADGVGDGDQVMELTFTSGRCSWKGRVRGLSWISRMVLAKLRSSCDLGVPTGGSRW